MNKTINELTSLSSADSGDELIIYDVSENASKKITKDQILSGMQTELTFDNVPTANSNNPAKSGGIFSSLSVITATSATITGVSISSGSIIRVMFTSAITGSDTTTGLSINYNSVAIPVKVGKNGSLADFVASDISGTYTYLQAYTTLELAYDGTQFIIIGNPVVISSADYTIYADGQTIGIDTAPTSNSTNFVTSGGLYTKFVNTIQYGLTMTDSSITYDAETLWATLPNAGNYIKAFIYSINGGVRSGFYMKYDDLYGWFIVGHYSQGVQIYSVKNNVLTLCNT